MWVWVGAGVGRCGRVCVMYESVPVGVCRFVCVNTGCNTNKFT